MQRERRRERDAKHLAACMEKTCRSSAKRSAQEARGAAFYRCELSATAQASLGGAVAGGWRRRWCQGCCWRWFLGSAAERRGCAQDRVAQPLATGVLSLPVKHLLDLAGFKRSIKSSLTCLVRDTRLRAAR